MKSLTLLLTSIVAILAPSVASAQISSDTIPANNPVDSLPSPLSFVEKSVIVDSVSSPWTEWNTVSLSGKFRMSGLPLSPSVKIFMERDSIILLSLRAPLIGEVGRAEISDSTILVVNKMNQTYVEEPLEDVLSHYPGTLSDLQDLILGRITIPGSGLLGADSANAIDIFAEQDGTYTIVAADEYRIPGFNYGYVVDSSYVARGLMVLPENKDVTVSLIYEKEGDNNNIDFNYQADKHNYKATLELNRPQWGANSFGNVKIGRQYRRLDFQEFIKAVGK